jgi:hypothetical protein
MFGKRSRPSPYGRGAGGEGFYNTLILQALTLTLPQGEGICGGGGERLQCLCNAKYFNRHLAWRNRSLPLSFLGS